MQELGVWVTNAGTVPATLELESEAADVNAQELPDWVGGMAKGALAGAATGAAAGPWGALIGAAAGGALGAATSAAGPVAPPAAAAATSQSGAPTATATGKPAPPSDAAKRAQVAVALQQFAAMVPTLVQLLAAKGGGAREIAANGFAAEEADGAWGPESFAGTWSVP